jgi:cell fate regulator YaaT (PSP1 superfamily)
MVYLASVRFGRMNTTENFTSNVEDLRTDDEVIIQTSRGIEHGIIASQVTQQERDDIKGLGEILRKATEDDLKILEHIQAHKEPDEMGFCNEQIQELKLPMKLTAVEHLFGGDKIIFYFLADGRVDFRQLVKTLAKRYRTRIEMRQIGVRDEARLLADYEHCGQELCCRTFMQSLEPVTMRMAKLQKTTLDPSKISGHCGRLMCCLRFEDETYAEYKKKLPGKGSYVRTDEVAGEVVDYCIIKQTCRVETRDGDRVTVHVDDIVERKPKSKGKGGKGRRGRGERSDRSDRSEKSNRSDKDDKGDKSGNDRKGGGCESCPRKGGDSGGGDDG